MSSLTHLIGACLAVAGLVLLVVSAAIQGSIVHVVTYSIFGVTMIVLYVMSTVYHYICSTKILAKRVFQILDHISIYLLIAGTYTPVALIALRGAWGWTIFGLVWGIAIIGILIKALAIKIPAWVSVALYLSMGWLIVIAMRPLLSVVTGDALMWLVAGGVFYSIGALFFALDRLVPRSRWFGMHEIFHVFVMLGTFSHFWLLFRHLVHIA